MRAATEAGLFYAGVTFLQLLPPEAFAAPVRVEEVLHEVTSDVRLIPIDAPRGRHRTGQGLDVRGSGREPQSFPCCGNAGTSCPLIISIVPMPCRPTHGEPPRHAGGA